MKPMFLTPGEVALLFRVDPKTVGRWATVGRIPSTKTPGGHRRYPYLKVRELLLASASSDAERAELEHRLSEIIMWHNR